MCSLYMLPSFSILVPTLKLNYLSNMPRDPLNPCLYSFLIELLIPAIAPCFCCFYTALRCTFLRSLLHPKPARLDCIQIRRVTTPK
ncbi:hypothetical protein K402DRAFT_440103 [Aulographum hederae CBS 113979]|uniref:Uncharacterized protein n=1 Tax=Aulographum hederae CBS 113979 TaxID=1176131 RepID=A0A6G1HBG2_9PEZI|nr:hypothetical protein K402DRAFT_440103 [Aulographum hederae CBS 113979]